jgi:hypothetical protein
LAALPGGSPELPHRLLRNKTHAKAQRRKTFIIEMGEKGKRKKGEKGVMTGLSGYSLLPFPLLTSSPFSLFA